MFDSAWAIYTSCTPRHSLTAQLTPQHSAIISTGKRVFIVGPGRIGWTVLELLVSEGHIVTGFKPSKARAAEIKNAGALTVIGDLHDNASIAQQVAKYDIVLHTATADDLPSVGVGLLGEGAGAAAEVEGMEGDSVGG